MRKFFHIFLFITGTIFFTQCNSSPKKENTSVSISSGKDSCCMKAGDKTNYTSALQSEITCPACGYKKIETLPTEVCLLKYTCEVCKKEMSPKGEDCCVFCSYGTHKCPSKQ